MEPVKVNIANKTSALVTCPKCESTRELDLSNKDIPYLVMASCICGNKYSVQFDKRIYYRKQVRSTGTCCKGSGSVDSKPITIVDISRSGISFIIERDRSFDVDDEIKLEFALGGTNVRCIVKIMSIIDTRIGAKFDKLDEHTQKIIGFFLMP
jgi:PilZ domain